jgi:2-iminobutanoate/2-iminopropanoate deaminase
MRKLINPDAIARPASAYNHAMLIERPARMLYLSGQIGERPDGSISEDFGEQAQQAWARPYSEIHQETLGEPLPPRTLVLVAGLGRLQYLVEVEAVAAR